MNRDELEKLKQTYTSNVQPSYSLKDIGAPTESEFVEDESEDQITSYILEVAQTIDNHLVDLFLDLRRNTGVTPDDIHVPWEDVVEAFKTEYGFDIILFSKIDFNPEIFSKQEKNKLFTSLVSNMEDVIYLTQVENAQDSYTPPDFDDYYDNY